MESDEECPELIPLEPSSSVKIPVTIITGFLGQSRDQLKGKQRFLCRATIGTLLPLMSVILCVQVLAKPHC